MLGFPESLSFSIIYYANERTQGLPFGMWEKSLKLPSVLNIKHPLGVLPCDAGTSEPSPYSPSKAHTTFLERVHFPSLGVCKPSL